MAIPDVFEARYAQVSTLINSNADRGTIAGMKMLADKELPHHWRMKVLLLLVLAIDDWFEREVRRYPFQQRLHSHPFVTETAPRH